MFNARRFFQDNNIPFVDGGHKHCRPGWVNVACPFCTGNSGYHLGYCEDKSQEYAGAFVCWRCKGKHPIRAIKALTGTTNAQAKGIFHAYKGRIITGGHKHNKSRVDPNLIFRDTKLPKGCVEISESPAAAEYTIKRKYVPKYLTEVWGVKATTYKGIYKFRLVVPITFNGKIVSYQCRDYTGKSEVPYMACKMEDEQIHHKNMVGGFDQAIQYGVTHPVLVEGFFDAFRLGPGAVCCFGIAYRSEQIRFIAEHFKGVSVLFDGGEKQARARSRTICTELSHRGLDVQEVLLDKGDPDELPASEARKLMDTLIK